MNQYNWVVVHPSHNDTLSTYRRDGPCPSLTNKSCPGVRRVITEETDVRNYLPCEFNATPIRHSNPIVRHLNHFRWPIFKRLFFPIRGSRRCWHNYTTDVIGLIGLCRCRTSANPDFAIDVMECFIVFDSYKQGYLRYDTITCYITLYNTLYLAIAHIGRHF